MPKLGHVGAGALQHPSVDGRDQPRFFGERDKGGRQEHPPMWMAPAYERFELDRTGSGWRQAGQWLVMQLQFVAIESSGELVLVADAHDRATPEPFLEQLDATLGV